ncbi:MAG TPA: Sua5/YciO/YrdC/YwlC family protein [Tepidisphaeraceae bacterium]|jgi:protein-tyrosine phosphatase|nr:Sua5/YciO/YrdC/YwlC family protein [Tepidisphaeraceae bacterium]
MNANVISIFEAGDYEAQVHRAQEILRGGGLVVLPTETLYGAAGLLGHPESRRRLRELRGDVAAKAFTVHLARPGDAGQYLGMLTEYEQRLIRKLWPGPVGLNFLVDSDRRQQVAATMQVQESDIFDDNSITLRCPDHILAEDVLGGVTGPVALTAVGNGGAGAGDEHAEVGKQIAESMGEKVDLVLDAGPTKYSKPSTLLRVRGDKYEIVRVGVYDERIIERLLRTTILFVCSGNTCRSPMAEVITRQLLAHKLDVPEAELEKKGISVISAGSFAFPGAKATQPAQDVVRQMGADLSHHRSRPLTVELIHQADVIFTMSKNHAQQVMSLVPSAGEKVSTLDPSGDIEDPIGGDVQLYKDLAGQLRLLIEKRLSEKVLM